MLTDVVRHLRPHESILTVMLEERPTAVKQILKQMTPLEHLAFQYNWHYRMRPMQVPPDEFETWVIQGGRGTGKTRPGAEQVVQWAKELGKDYGRGAKIALIAKDPADARDVMIEGESGILPVSPPWFRPRYEPTKRRLTWDNGVTAHIYSSEVPDDLRGPQHHKGWLDEFCKWRYPDQVWDMYTFGLRLGDNPQSVITTTPRPVQAYIDILKEPGTVVTRGKTDDNYANLSSKFLNRVYRKYQGTRLGRQELDADLLQDTPGALWTLSLIDKHRVDKAPEMDFIVVAIDPGVTDPKGDPELQDSVAETGMVVVGRGIDGHGYVMHDISEACSPDTWAKKAVTHYDTLRAERIIGEVNNGGDLVEAVIRAAAKDLEIRDVVYKKIHASRGKRTRAEPISALYEQGRMHHVGTFPDLEDQMTTWVPGMKSPDRMDALVWGATEAVLGAPDDLLFG